MINFIPLLASAGIPFADYVTQAAQRWGLSGAGLFLAEGHSIMHAMTYLAFGMMALMFAVEIFGGGTGEAAIPKVMYRMVRYVIPLWLLTYYNQPFYGGMPFHKLMPEEARQLAQIANDGSVAKAQAAMDQLDRDSTAKTAFWDAGEKFTLLLMKGVIWGYSGLMLFLSSGGYILEAVAVTVGPLSIPFLTFEKTAFLFWNWFEFWIASSMFQVIAAVLSNIFANIELLAMPGFSNLDQMQLLGAQAALLIALVITGLMIGGIAASLYGKGAAHAANIASFVGGYLSRF